jgi:glutamate synthase (NADPH/NADH) large chain
MQSNYPMQEGLYNPENEHDACGVGMLVNIHGNKSHELVDSALKVLENMRHRGAEGADNKSGDGAGIMLQIPHEFILLQGTLRRENMELALSSSLRTRRSRKPSSTS